ncbi:carbamoyltransferase N-terminal domain-containing protein [Pseudovibrio denitrificans]|uniref:carbamoyltransferase N-terminal domain-containing protein n=1 Tax=Pseudovibrio denitrificans TaxID=258256 RepID=UPI0039BF9599
MLFCGLKLTHDGGVALIDDSKLIFSIEMEKIEGAKRHSKLDDFKFAFDLLEQHGYNPREVDRFIIDGWRKTEKTRLFYDQEVHFSVAPYRLGFISSDPMRKYTGEIHDFKYESYHHYTTHAVGSYCSSPFAGVASWVLVWDGAMFPNLYYIDPSAGDQLHHVGTVSNLIGNAYHEMALRLPPFNTGATFPETLAIPGKMMAFIARGRTRKQLVDIFRSSFVNACERFIPARKRGDEGFYQEALGHAILNATLDELPSLSSFMSEDVLASWHSFIYEVMFESLVAKIAASGKDCRRLVFCGGCALNIKWNTSLRDSQAFDEVWVPPFPNDSGSALGAAATGMVSEGGWKALEWTVYSGPELSGTRMLPGWKCQSCSVEELAQLIHESGEPVVVLHGRAEIGPRALGNRSIIASATQPAMKTHLNVIKRREDFRPVAPICLQEEAAKVFDIHAPDAFMVFECGIREEWRDRIPAVAHEDFTARVQTVSESSNIILFKLLQTYHALSGIPVLCNTSANETGRGFFASVSDAMRWGKTNFIWSEGTLYKRERPIPAPHLHRNVLTDYYSI